MTRLRHLVRRLRNAPLFTALSVLTLGLGIGANTAIFSMLDGILLKPLPFHQSENLVSVLHQAPELAREPIGLSQALYFTYREQGRTFEDVALYRTSPVTVTGRGRPQRVDGMLVTEALLPLLRVRPHLGRFFSRQDDLPGAPPTVVVSHGYWTRELGADRRAVGRALQIDGVPWTIIGVLPRDFHFLDLESDVIMPFRFDRAQARMANFSARGLARLKPGYTTQQAEADVERMIPLATEEFTRGLSLDMLNDAGFAPYIRPLKSEVVGAVGEVLWVLLATVGIVLLIACANVANLFLVRTEGRRREFGVRRALGASRLQVVREILSETLMLGLLSGVLGVFLAGGAIELLRMLEPGNLPRLTQIAVDGKALLFAAAVTLLSVLCCSVLPLLGTLRLDLVKALKGGSRGASQAGQRHRARNVLVAGQVGLALTLLIGSGLLTRSFIELSRVEPGFSQPEDVLTMRLYVPQPVIPDAVAAARTHQRIKEEIESLPGVRGVGLVSTRPLAGEGSYDDLLDVQEFPVPAGQMPPGRLFKWISPDYLETMGIPLLAGRALEWNDVHNLTSKVLVNESFTRLYWPEPAQAVGKRLFESGNRNPREIVGVIGDVREDGLAQPVPPIVYWPLLVSEFWGQEHFILRSMSYVVRVDRRARTGLAQSLQDTVWSVNGNLAVADMQGMDAIVAHSSAQRTFTLVMLAAAAAGALLLAVVGIYGVISHTVSQRTREIGIRAALGADRRAIRLLVLRHGAVLTVAGLLMGLAASALLTGWMSSLLFQTSGFDPLTYLVVTALLGVVALLATYLPARRASRLDPLEALRWE
ncbi:MAG TPA: ABC transporter permease [Acidobacteriota bacterium]|nr:ABC transporter permease [Acidobacteriota bacterium]